MENINILYIDDDFQPQLSQYLDNKYSQKENGFTYDELEFTADTTLAELLNNSKISNANIVLLDSRLFQNTNVGEEKFSGEEVKTILQKYLPFVEILIITQNDSVDGYDFIKKFKSSRTQTNHCEYYDRELNDKIENAIKKINAYRLVFSKIASSGRFDEPIINKLKDSIEGILEYDELRKSDIDDLIKAFKELESKYE